MQGIAVRAADADGIGVEHYTEQAVAVFAFDIGDEIRAAAQVGDHLAQVWRAQGDGQGVLQQLLGADAGQRRQRMPGTAAEVPAPWAQAQGLVLRIGFEVTGVGDEELELLGQQALVQALPVIDLKLHSCLGVAADEPANRPWYQARCGRGTAAETQLACLQTIELADLVAQLARAADQPPRVFEHHQALLGRRQFLVRAVHQLAAGTVLQGLDATAEGRLREVHRGRRGDEAAVLGEGDQVAELAQVYMHFSHKKYRANAFALPLVHSL
ncbi:hypothetical protein D9M71_408370 [compost metagenome]